jgi:hypothetical protein
MTSMHTAAKHILLIVMVGVSVAQATPPAPPMSITVTADGSVNLAQSLTVKIRVSAGYELKNVSASILDGDGYKVNSQVEAKLGLLKQGDSACFSGAIQPLAKGTWKVGVVASGYWPYDTAAIHASDEFYIVLSDTLSEVISASDYIIRQNRTAKGKVERLTGAEKTISLPPGKRAKPAPRSRDSHTPGMPQRQPKNDDDTVGVKPPEGIVP